MSRARERHPERHRARTGGVVVAWCTGGLVCNKFMDSVLSVMLREQATGAHRIVGQMSLMSGPRIAEARNQIVRAFLVEYPEAEWLWMLDDDMTFEPDMLDKLLEVADVNERPVVGGLAFAGERGCRIRPTLYNFTSTEGDMDSVWEYPKDAVVKIGATGAACLLIHRNVLNRLGRVHGMLSDGVTANPYPWFAEGMLNNKGVGYGEDIVFCMRLNAQGIPLHVHTGAKLGHVKTWEITEDDFDAQEANIKPIALPGREVPIAGLGG